METYDPEKMKKKEETKAEKDSYEQGGFYTAGQGQTAYGGGLPLGAVDYGYTGYAETDKSSRWAPQEKMSFFKQIGVAFLPPLYGKYKGITQTGMNHFMRQIVILAILIGLIKGVFSWFQLGGIKGALDQVFPDFEIKDGVMTLEEPFEVYNNRTYIYADDEIDTFTQQQLKTFATEKGTRYSSIILMGRSEYVEIKGNVYITTPWSDYQDQVFNKEWIKNQLIQKVGIFFVITLVLVIIVGYFLYLLLYKLVSWIYSLFGKLIAAVARKSVTSLNMRKAAVYAMLPGIIVNFFVQFLPPIIQMEIGMFFIILYVFLPIIIMAIAVPKME